MKCQHCNEIAVKPIAKELISDDILYRCTSCGQGYTKQYASFLEAYEAQFVHLDDCVPEDAKPVRKEKSVSEARSTWECRWLTSPKAVTPVEDQPWELIENHHDGKYLSGFKSYDEARAACVSFIAEEYEIPKEEEDEILERYDVFIAKVTVEYFEDDPIKYCAVKEYESHQGGTNNLAVCRIIHIDRPNHGGHVARGTSLKGMDAAVNNALRSLAKKTERNLAGVRKQVII